MECVDLSLGCPVSLARLRGLLSEPACGCSLNNLIAQYGRDAGLAAKRTVKRCREPLSRRSRP